MNAQFKRDMAKILNKVGEGSNKFVRSVALELGKGMVEKSPVDVGRFKGNWQYGVGAVNMTTDSPADKSGALTMGRITAGVATFKTGQTIYITNSLPYAKRLEYGWSQQAATGMVRVTVESVMGKINTLARGIR